MAIIFIISVSLKLRGQKMLMSFWFCKLSRHMKLFLTPDILLHEVFPRYMHVYSDRNGSIRDWILWMLLPRLWRLMGCTDWRRCFDDEDRYTVAVFKVDTVVGHIPRKISRICSLFLTRGDAITCTPKGGRRHLQLNIFSL